MVIELKNDLKLEGVLYSVDMYLNIKLENLKPVDADLYPQFTGVQKCFIRGSVVRYVHLPREHVDTQLLQDATRRAFRNEGIKKSSSSSSS